MGGSLGGLSGVDYAVEFGRAFIGLLFVVAGVTKLPNVAALARTVRAYEILPASWARWVSRVLPPLEIGAGLTFAAGISPRLTGVVLAALLAAFSFGVAVNLRRGRRTIDCGCFGSRSGRGISWTIVLRNAAFGVVAAVAGWRSGQIGASAVDVPAVLAAGAALAIYGAARAVLATFRLDDHGAEAGPRTSRRHSPPTVSAGVASSPSREGA